MADIIRSRIFDTGTNCLDRLSRQRIDDFLTGKSKHLQFVERVKLNETYEEDSGCTHIITFEMNHMTGRWRKLKARTTRIQSRPRFFGRSRLNANGDLEPYQSLLLDRVICGR